MEELELRVWEVVEADTEPDEPVEVEVEVEVPEGAALARKKGLPATMGLLWSMIPGMKRGLPMRRDWDEGGVLTVEGL